MDTRQNKFVLAGAMLALATASAAQAAIVFEDTFDGTTPFGSSVARTLGTGTGLTNTITNSPALGAAGDNYLNSAIALGTQGRRNVVTYTPDSGSGFDAFQGPSIGDKLVLNGGFDIFLRANDVESTLATWFRPIDVNNRSNGSAAGATGLRIIFNGLGTGNEGRLQLQLASSTGNTTVFASDAAFTTGTASFKALNSAGAITVAEGGTYHLGFTLSTAGDGLITAKIFGRSDTEEINTQVATDQIGSISFYGNATTIGTAFASTGANAVWTLFEDSDNNGAPRTSAISADYDTVRLYSGTVTSFGALVPEPATLGLLGLAGVLGLGRRRRV